jgi:hypothetical protein
MTSDKYKVIHEERNATSKFFADKWAESDENKRFVRMLQYNNDQLAKFTAGNRVPYVLDFITQPINTYIGDQRDSRTDIKYLPQESGDEVRVELLNAVKDVTLRRNKWVWLESDVFMDGIVEKAGAIGYEWSTERHPLGSLDMFRVPIRQLTWDINRREYDLETSSWVSRTRLYSRRTLIAKYPDFEEEIKALSLQGSELDDLKLDESYFKTIIDTELSAVALIEFYERKYKERYFVTKVRNGEPLPEIYQTKRAAQDAIAKMREADTRAAIEQSGPLPDDSYDIIKKHRPCILKSEVTSNIDFLADEEQSAPFYPYDIYYPFWEDGEYWAIMDLYKDPQRFINKMFSMVDHQIATGSKGLLFLDELIPEEKAKQIFSSWSTAGGGFRVPNPKDNVVFIPPASFDPKLLDAMQAAMLNIEKKAGGANYLGRRESSAESGVAVQRRQERASVASFMIYDNLDRFKLSVGEKVAWYITHLMTAQQKIRIEGDQLTQFAKQHYPNWLFQPSQTGQPYGFMEINSTADNTMDDLRTDIIVDKSAHAATQNQETLMTMQQLGQAFPTLAETMPPQLLISLFDLPMSKKYEMMQAAEEAMKARMEAARAAANPPPSLSANLKDVALFSDNPGLQAQFLGMFGLKMEDGEVVIDEEAEVAKREKGLKLLSSVADREFKREKHDDQMALKMAEMKEHSELEEKKIAAQKEQAEQKRKADAKKAAKTSSSKG